MVLQEEVVSELLLTPLLIEIVMCAVSCAFAEICAAT
jgi:hypothetical protein